jgi:hypothetical protein
MRFAFFITAVNILEYFLQWAMVMGYYYSITVCINLFYVYMKLNIPGVILEFRFLFLFVCINGKLPAVSRLRLLPSLNMPQYHNQGPGLFFY